MKDNSFHPGYKKIDIYRKVKGGVEYLCSTTWSKTCTLAKQRHAEINNVPVETMRGYFSKFE